MRRVTSNNSTFAMSAARAMGPARSAGRSKSPHLLVAQNLPDAVACEDEELAAAGQLP